MSIVGDVADMTVGMRKKHPKVFVGMYKHALFSEKHDTCSGPDCAGLEYRSTDRWYLPGLAHIHHGTLETPREWAAREAYGREANRLPSVRADEVCARSLSD